MKSQPSSAVSVSDAAFHARFRQMVEAAGDVIYTTDTRGCFTYVNPRVEKLLGYRPEQVIGKQFTDLIAPRCEAEVKAFYTEQYQQRTAETSLEFPVLTAAGKEIWIEQIVVLLEEGDAITGFQATVRDITRRKQAEHTLQENERRYRALLDQTNDAVLILDLEGVHLAANQKAADLLGYEPDELIGMSFLHIVSASEQGPASQMLQTLKSGQRAPMYERTFCKKSGVEFPAEVTLALVRDPDDTPVYVLGFVRDLSERKRTDAIIQHSEVNLRRNVERVEAILNSSSDAIILTYADGTLQQANPAFTQLLGYQADDLFSKPLAVLVEPDWTTPLNLGIAAAMESRQPRRIEVVARRQDGTTFSADAVLSPIASDRRQPPSGIICSLRDITERKQMEAELRQALEKEKEFSALKTRFVSMASHEFRTPLATIQATCDTLRNYIHKMSPEQVAARFEKIQGQVKHMALMLDDVLTLGRLQDGRMEFHPVEIEVNPFCQEIVDELRGLNATHELVYTVALGEGRARVDRKLMRQVITNLLTNAIKYSPQDSTVRFEVHEEDGWLVMHVTDSGIGIPEEDQKHLFMPFHRAANVGEVSGTGLGLAITKQGVELHGGTITCDSTVGEGTTFTISIPIILTDEEESQ
jgi:PAS domain S-box-containing protein